MTTITTHSDADLQRQDLAGGGTRAALRLLQAVLGLAAACRGKTALAMMSERDLRDVGLLPWEVRSEFCR
jgi:uncharacterized protein YjiS (DUF1127 family)